MPAVRLADLDVEHLVLRHPRRDARQGLPPGAAHAHEQGVAQILANHARDATDVLRGVEEEHEVHSRLALLVVIHQLLLHNRQKRLKICHLLVRLGPLHKIGVHQFAELDDVHNPVLVRVEMGEDAIELQPGVSLHHLFHEIEEPHAIVVIHESIVEDAQGLVAPEANNGRKILRRSRNHGDTLPNLAQVAHVVRVVALGRRREKFLADGVVNFQRRLDQVGRLGHNLEREVSATTPPVHDGAVDPREGSVVELAHRDEVEVAKKPRGDWVSAAARRTHRRRELHVDELSHRELGPIVPSLVIHKLTEELDGRLRAVLLQLGHVQIVDEDDRALANRWPEDTLTALIELRVDDVLNLVGARLRRERALHVLKLGLILLVQGLFDVHRLTRARRAAEQHVFPVGDQQIEEEPVPDRVDGGDDDVLKLELLAHRRDVNRLEPISPLERLLVEVKVVHGALAARGERLVQLLLG